MEDRKNKYIKKQDSTNKEHQLVAKNKNSDWTD